MHHPASNPAYLASQGDSATGRSYATEAEKRDLDFSSFETILGLMKNLSRNNLESLIEVGFEQIREEDRLAIEAGKPPKRDSLYEVTKDLARQVKRRVSENDVLPEGWSRLDEYAVCFDEDLDELNGDGDSSSESSSGGSESLIEYDSNEVCPSCGAISGEEDGKLCFCCEFEKDSVDPHASASNVLGSARYHRSSAVDFHFGGASNWENRHAVFGEPGSPSRPYQPLTASIDSEGDVIPMFPNRSPPLFDAEIRITNYSGVVSDQTSLSPRSVPCFLCGEVIPVGERCEECHRGTAELESVRQRLEKLDPEQ